MVLPERVTSALTLLVSMKSVPPLTLTSALTLHHVPAASTVLSRGMLMATVTMPLGGACRRSRRCR